MSTSRIMAILLCLCFTFAGASPVWAEPINVDGDRLERVTEQGQVRARRNNETVTGHVVTLGEIINYLQRNRDSIQVITKDNPTCYWYWDGSQWRRYCY